MVRFRKTYLFVIWLVLIIILFTSNWIGLRDRYVTNGYSTIEAGQVVVGELEVAEPGLEMAFLTPSHLNVIGGLTTLSWEETVYSKSNWEIDPLVTLSIGDFDGDQKGDELIVISQSGMLILIAKEGSGWTSDVIGYLPWSAPVWTTYAVASGQIIANSISLEVAIVGELFNSTTSTAIGQVYVVNRLNNVTWQINQVAVFSNPLYCVATGDVNITHPGDEIVTAGFATGVHSLTYSGGLWESEVLYPYGYIIRSIAVGNIIPSTRSSEIAFVMDQEVVTLYYEGGRWRSDLVWDSNIMGSGMDSVDIADIDPFIPGLEILGSGFVFEPYRPILVGFSYTSTIQQPWIVWNPIERPIEIVVSNFDFYRVGAEIIIVNDPTSTVLSIPNDGDRTMRASSTVLLPAFLFLPATFLIFALADYIGRVADLRRRRYALEMVSKGFVKCRLCQRFVPKDKLEAHLRWHRTQQFKGSGL
ncbi:MAG: hypothetical protein ACFFAL_11315 [Promethearchaeota archaeon]